MCSAALFAAAIIPPLLAAWGPDPSGLAVLRRPEPGAAVEVPPFRDWLTGFVPPNIVKAAADGALLPLVGCTSLFAFALRRTSAQPRETLLRACGAIAESMFVLLKWILALAPAGVFACRRSRGDQEIARPARLPTLTGLSAPVVLARLPRTVPRSPYRV